MKQFLFIIIISIFFISCNNKEVKTTDIKLNNKKTENIVDHKKVKKVDLPNRKEPDLSGTQKEYRLYPDERVENYLKPYRAELKKKTDTVIAKLGIDLIKGKPDSTLGRFAAEIIRVKAQEYSKLKVDFSILNNGGLRKPLYKGDIKIKDIYELMPFDNYIVVLSFTGLEVKQMCKEMIKVHGVPIANLQIKTGEVSESSCTVGNKKINDKQKYLVATINYLYKVGEGVPTLKTGKLIKNMTNHLFRDAIIEYLKEKKVINKVIPVQYRILRN